MDVNSLSQSRDGRTLHSIHTAPKASYRPPPIPSMIEVETTVPRHSSYASQISTEPHQTHAHFDARLCFPGESLSASCGGHDRGRDHPHANTCRCHLSGFGVVELCLGCHGRCQPARRGNPANAEGWPVHLPWYIPRGVAGPGLGK